MASPSPRPSAGKAVNTRRPNGILPISVSATQQRTAPIVLKPSTKASTARMKVVVRRLPPSLTLAELEAILGDEWKVNEGKVDWFSYQPGKLSKE